jgi:hypothetical protein
MRSLSPLVGTSTFDETGSEPGRDKRGAYEGFAGPGGHGALAIRSGPGGFSLTRAIAWGM